MTSIPLAPQPALPHEVLTRTVELLSVARSVERVTEVVTAGVRELVGADGTTFVLREDGFCHYVDENAISPLWKGSSFPLTSCISGWAMLHRQTVLISDIYADDRVPLDAYRPTFVQSLAMAPIRSAAPIGALGAYWSTQHVPSPADVRHLEVIANSAAVALENIELRGAVGRRSTERDELAVRADELEAAIHTIAHDLRSPLGAMMGYAELIGDATTGVPADFARTIVQSGRRMSDQIDRMLALYRITHAPIEPEPVDLTGIARAIAHTLVVQAPERRIEVEVADDLTAVADPVLAHLLLENLLNNAVKYTGLEETARIVVARVDLQHVGVPDPLTTFVVHDNGTGFAPEAAARLFQPLVRLHADEDFAGTGLGLASAARIVELHGGQMTAEGEESVGAAFYFSLPRSD